jgi:hypothetical protein
MVFIVLQWPCRAHGHCSTPWLASPLRLTSNECLSLIITGCTASRARMITFCMLLKSSLVASVPARQPGTQRVAHMP